jgi:hypothetical protein
MCFKNDKQVVRKLNNSSKKQISTPKLDFKSGKTKLYFKYQRLTYLITK